MYNLSKEESDRIKIIKFIAIILVVYLHSYTAEIHFSDGNAILYLPAWLHLFEKGLSQIVSGCSVQLFFLFSSILFFKTDQTYGTVIRKKSKTLIIPYLIWNSFWIIVFIFLQSLPFTAAYFSGSNTPILQCSLREWFGLYGIGENYPQCYPLWFVRDLIVMFLIFPVIKKAVDRYPKMMLAVGVMLVIIPFGFYGKMALEWFIIGAVIVKMQIHITILDKIPMPIVTIAYCLGAVVVLLLDINVLRNIFIFMGIVFWIRISKEIFYNKKLGRGLLRMSEWTFIIYVSHELTLSSVQKICLRLFPVSPVFLFWEYVLIPVFVITGCLTAGIVFKKVMPGLYMVATGER